jgi:predicted small lipoprotein YifL
MVMAQSERGFLAAPGMRACAIARVIVLGALLAGAAGCGQKGPLYLPDKGGDVVTRPAGQTQQSPQSPETAPQPSTQPQPNPTDSEKKNQTPPR